MISKTIMGNLREDDFVGRWGGEEFIAIITHVDRKQLFVIAEKLRLLVSQSGFELEGEQIHASVSIGATLAKKGEPMENLVKRADRLMYESKGFGRNYVTMG
jgi:diguanylate cyclase (GGDEF)-like protein